MASLPFIVIARDSQGANVGDRMTGLTPTWAHLKRLSDNADVAQPSITEVANGVYKFSFDAESLGDSCGQIDFGATLTAHSDRYFDILLTRDSSRIITFLDELVSAAKTLTSGERNSVADAIFDRSDAIESALTLREAVRHVVADAVGDRVLEGSNLVLKSLDGTKDRATGVADGDTGERTVSARDAS